MAINTSGFGIHVMPQYVPADPSLVAFNPQAITSGVLSSIQVANELAKRKAFLAQQAEQDAIRQGRIQALNAQNAGVAQVAPHAALADIALADKTVALAPGEVELGRAKNKGALSDISFNESVRPSVEESKRIAAETAAATAPIQADIAIGTAKNASRAVDEEAEIGPAKHELDLAKTHQAIDSIISDKNLSDETKVATIRHLTAQAKAAEANAAYLNRDKPKAASDSHDELQKELGHVETSIQRLENSRVNNPNIEGGLPVPLITYQGQVHEPTGAVKNVDKFAQFMRELEPMKTDPRAEQNAAELKRLYALRDNLNSQLTNGIAAANGVAVAPPTQAPAQGAAQANKVYTPAEAAKLPKGTVFTGTDGKKHVRN